MRADERAAQGPARSAFCLGDARRPRADHLGGRRRRGGQGRRRGRRVEPVFVVNTPGVPEVAGRPPVRAAARRRRRTGRRRCEPDRPGRHRGDRLHRPAPRAGPRAPSSPTSSCYMNADTPGPAVRHPRRRRRPRRAAAVPRVRAVEHLNVCVRFGGDDVAGAALRRRRKVLEVMQRDRVTVFEGVPTMYIALLHHPDRGALRPVVAAGRRLRRRADPGRGPRRVRAAVRHRDPRGLRADRDGVDDDVQRQRRGAQDLQRRQADLGRRGADLGRRRPAAAARPRARRRDRRPRRQRDERLPRQPGGDRRGVRRRLVPHRRPRLRRRGRLLLHRRPQEGPDHPRRLQRLPARGRGGPLHAPGRRRGRRGRRARRAARRGGQGVRGADAPGPRPPRRSSSSSSRSGWPPTSTRGRSSSAPSCRRAPTGKILKKELKADRVPAPR